MLVPKATVNLNDLSSRCKDKIWLPRQGLDVETIAITQTMNELPHFKLGLHPLASDPPHVLAATLWS